MTLKNAFGNIALDASVQDVETAVNAVTSAVNTVATNTAAALTDTQLRANPVPVSIPSAVEIKNDAGAPINISADALPLPLGAATDATVAALNAIQTQLTQLTDTMVLFMQMMANQSARLDNVNRLVVALETGANTVNVSGSLTSAGTVSTVTTVTGVTTLSNITAIGGVPVPFYAQDVPQYIYNGIGVS